MTTVRPVDRVLVAGPATSLVSLEEAKQHLRVDTDAGDSYIIDLVEVATGVVEDETARALLTQTWDVFLDDFPPHRDTRPEILRHDDPWWTETSDKGAVTLPLPPLQSVEEIEYVDTDGATQTLALSDVIVDTAREPGRIVPANGEEWPSVRVQPRAIRIRIKAGYGDVPGDVPAWATHAARLIVSHFYENREPAVVGSIVSQIPMSARYLMQQHSMKAVG